MVGRWTHLKSPKVWLIDWLFWENTQGNKEGSLAMALHSWSALGWWPSLFSPWATWPSGGRLSYSLAYLVMHLPVVFVCSLPGTRDLVAPTALWPMASREPETGSSWEQAKLPGWLLGRCLRTPKDGTLKWSRNSGQLAFVLILLRMAGLCLGFMEISFETGSPTFSQIAHHLNKNLFSFASAPASWVWLFLQLADHAPFLAW